jgi:hypothetical protein
LLNRVCKSSEAEVANEAMIPSRKMTTGRRRTRPPPRANLLWTLRFQLRNQDISMWGAGGALGHMFKRFNLMSDRRDEKQLIEASRVCPFVFGIYLDRDVL